MQGFLGSQENHYSYLNNRSYPPETYYGWSELPQLKKDDSSSGKER